MSTITTLKLLTHDIVDTNDSTFPVARMVRGFNKAQNKIVNIILQKDTLEQWDDENYTDLNEGLINIVSGQADYSIKEDENFANVIAISKVYIKSSATATDEEYVELTKGHKRITIGEGIPTEYRISGKSIIFDITPDYSCTGGIKVMFKRIPQDITVNDTTKEIGIPSTYHHLLALYTAYDYARAKRMDNRKDILEEISKEHLSLGFFVGRQDFNTTDNITSETIYHI